MSNDGKSQLCSCGYGCDYREEDYGPHGGYVTTQAAVPFYSDICPRHVCQVHQLVAHTDALWPAVDPDPRRTVKP